MIYDITCITELRTECRWPWAMHIIHIPANVFLCGRAAAGVDQTFHRHDGFKVPLVLIGFDPLMVIFVAH